MQVFESVTRIQGIPTPLVMRMEDRLEGGSSEIRASDVRYDSDIPDDVFDPTALPKLHAHPVWRSGN